MPETRSPGPNYQSFLVALNGESGGESTVLLTASRRLCRSLIADHSQLMLSRGRAAWATPPIFYWQDWLQGLAKLSDSRPGERVLSSAANQAVWEQAFASQLPEGISGVAGLARQGAAAARLLGEWCIDASEVGAAARGADEVVFANALQSYRKRLAARSWTDAATAAAQAIDAMVDAPYPLPRKVLLLGFDRLPPLVSRLVDAATSAGAVVESPEPGGTPGAPAVHVFTDDERELRAAGAWARSVLSTRPESRIGIVVSELEQDAERVLRLVREGFAPGWQLGGRAYEASVEVSYGKRLSDYPLIANALSCLEWSAVGLGSAAVSVLLRASSISGSRPGERAALDLKLRGFPDRIWSPAALAEVLSNEEDSTSTRAFLDRIRSLGQARGRLGGRELPSRWAKAVDELLGALGWPGDTSLTSNEFQLVNRWRELLNELAGLDAITGPVDFGNAVRRLALMASQVLFQPEVDGATLKVLGPLEAAGMAFDALWVARTDADRWPAAGHPLSVVARSVQVAHGMPDSTPADTLNYARRVLTRLAGSAADVHFSWSRADADSVRLPSPLLAELAAEEDDSPADPGWFAGQLVGTGELFVVESDPAPAMQPGETLLGGAHTVSLQRTEPFSAFAVGRLAIRDIEPFASGLSPRLRGILVHSALERLFEPGLGQTVLATWSGAERRKRLEAAVDDSLRYAERQADTVLRRLLAIERRQMLAALDAVIDAELARSPYTIEAVEQRMDYRHAGLRLELRADRIDRLDNGDLLVIDYKSGRPRPLVRNDGEPVDFQLPIYAAAIGQGVGGLGLLFVRPRNTSWRLTGRSVDRGKMEDELWARTLGEWREAIERLVEGIAGGDVRINLRGDAERSWQLNVLCRSAEAKRAD